MNEGKLAPSEMLVDVVKKNIFKNGPNNGTFLIDGNSLGYHRVPQKCWKLRGMEKGNGWWCGSENLDLFGLFPWDTWIKTTWER